MKQIYGQSFTEHGEKIIELIFSELRKAEAKHPGWPDDKIHAVGILVEEAGEAMQAAIDHTYAGADIGKLRIELAQTGAMAIRALLHLPAKEQWPCGHEKVHPEDELCRWCPPS